MAIPKHIKDVYKKSTCIFTTNEVEAALDRMAIKINEQLQDTNPIILCVMIGGMIPTGNLLPRLNFPLELDYVHASRYQGNIAGGDLVWKVQPKTKLKGRTVLIIDDILDGGLTLAKIIDVIKSHDPKEIYSAVLVDKKHRREQGGLQHADFVGLEVEDHYIFGYGMDYQEYLRNAPGIFMVAPEHEA